MPFSAYGATTTAFPQLRTVVRPDVAALPDDELAETVASETGADPVAMEDFLSGLRSFGNAVVQRLPAIAAGAAGGSVAGPGGAVLGGLLGGLTAPPPGAPGTPAAGPPTAAAGLVGLLANPAVQEALKQLMASRSGGRVRLPSGEEVPAVAFAELLREAADQVVAEQADGEYEMPEYLAEAEVRDHRRRHPAYHRSRVDPIVRAAVLVRALDPSGRPTQVTTVNQQPAYVPPAPQYQYPPPGYAPPGYAPPGYAPPGYAPPPPQGQYPPQPAPEPMADPFVSYTPPDLGGTGPTVYGIDQIWEFDQALDEILGPAERL